MKKADHLTNERLPESYKNRKITIPSVLLPERLLFSVAFAGTDLAYTFGARYFGTLQRNPYLHPQ